LNLEYFIAKRIITTENKKSSISTPIMKIAVSAIAIGMIMMIISIATGVGLQQKIREKIAAFSGHIIISNYDSNQSQVSTIPISTHQKFYPKFNLEGISHIQAVATKAAMIRTKDAVEGVIFKGVGMDYEWKNLDEYLISGKLPKFSSQINNEVIISEYLANRLNLKCNDNFNSFFMKEGENKLPNLRRFKIVGIYNSGFQDFDKTYIIGDLRHIQKLNHWQPDQIGNFEVFIDNFEDIDAKGIQVNKETPSTLKAITITQKFATLFDWLKLFDSNILMVIVLMIIVSTINIIVALLVLILERTQMIGILKAVGANNWSIRKIFLYNASHLIIRGLLWGNAIGIGLVLIQKYFKIITLPPENYFVNAAPVYLDFGYIFLLNLGTIVISVLVLLIPSYIITKISPVKAIRFQ
jgi:lipoprotein-releasing system permease protein